MNGIVFRVIYSRKDFEENFGRGERSFSPPKMFFIFAIHCNYHFYSFSFLLLVFETTNQYLTGKRKIILNNFSQIFRNAN